MSQINESGLSGVKLRSMNLNALEFVAVDDVIKAFEEHPYHKVLACLHKIAQPDYVPVKITGCPRFMIWSSPASHEVLRKIGRLDSNAKMPDTVVLDMVLSAILQQYYTGSVNFLSSGDKIAQGHLSKLSFTVQIDLDALASVIYPGAYTQVRWDSRLRWIQNVKKHAGLLISRGFLVSSTPKEGETGRVLTAEISPSVYTKLSSFIEDSPVYVSCVPCTAFRFGRGAYKQSPALYPAYRLLCTCLGLKYGNISAGTARKLSFEEFYKETGLPSYSEWCASQNVINLDPVKYCESVISNLFKPFETLISVRVLYQDQEVLVVPKVDICADKIV